MTRREKISIARHGQTEWNTQQRYQGSKNSDLTPSGIAQAHKVGEFLRERNIQEIYSSPLGRALQTTEIIHSIIGGSVQIIPQLAEMSFGVFEGQTQQDMKALHAEFFTQRKIADNKIALPYPDGESYLDVWNRLEHAVLAILASGSGHALIVAHNSVNKVIRGIILGKSLKEVVHHDQPNNQIIEINVQKSTEQEHYV